jgi:integrase
MASIKVMLKTSQPKKDGTLPILIRVTINRKVKYFTVGHSVKQHQFREGQDNWIVKHPDAALINTAIEVKRSELARTVYTAENSGQRLDMGMLSGKPAGGTFFSAVRQRLEILETRNQAGSHARIQSKLTILKKAWGQDVAISDLNKYWVDKYISFRIGQKVKQATIKKDLSDFAGILNGIDYPGVNYFKKAHRLFKNEPVNREKLTFEEIKLIETTPMTGMVDTARDMFLFSFYTHGMRFASVATFQASMIKNGLIRYRMEKGKKLREIDVHPKLQKLIIKYKGNKPYLFPVLKKEIKSEWDKRDILNPANALVNTYLKRVAIVCGIDKNIHMHIARHTFAFLSLSKDVSMEILKDALGHSNFKETAMYLKSLSDDKINKAVRGVYD